jgi:pimeloyl-ACP methyl ester carboxylesterase
MRFVVLAIGFLSAFSAAADREAPVERLASRLYTLHTAAGDAQLPLEASDTLGGEHAQITRAVIIFHGKGRNVEGYFKALRSAAPDLRHVILLAPQFLREEDAKAHRLPKEVLRWHEGSWSAGWLAESPVAISTFSVIDALLNDLGDRAKFPKLTTVVLFGHSGGGQLINRYAIVGTAPAALAAAGIRVRFVIANPSSYLYFTDDRPQPDGTLAPYRGAACSEFNRWRFGPLGAPDYVVDSSPAAWQQRESLYAHTDTIYLLGEEDMDPKQRDLDTSCAAEAQGPERLDRGKAYFRYLKGRHAEDFHQQLWFVPGVAHVGSRMVESPCGVAAAFDVGRCATQGGDGGN